MTSILKEIFPKGAIPIFDMDGVLVDFVDNSEINPGWKEDMMAEGYYRNLPPIDEGVALVKFLINELGPEHIYICTKGPTPHSFDEKKEWVKEYIPEFRQENIFPVPLDGHKAETMYDELKSRGLNPRNGVLLDDFGRGLKEWYDFWAAHDGHTDIRWPAVKIANGHNLKGKRRQLCPVIFLRSQEKALEDFYG